MLEFGEGQDFATGEFLSNMELQFAGLAARQFDHLRHKFSVRRHEYNSLFKEVAVGILRLLFVLVWNLEHSPVGKAPPSCSYPIRNYNVVFIYAKRTLKTVLVLGVITIDCLCRAEPMTTTRDRGW